MKCKFLRLKKLREFKDRWGEWIVCKDWKEQQWTVPKPVFEQFKYLGLPELDPTAEAQFNKWFTGKHYPEIPKEERYHLIKLLLETCTKEPIEFLFPNI